jgi:hypothetical protein
VKAVAPRQDSARRELAVIRRVVGPGAGVGAAASG